MAPVAQLVEQVLCKHLVAGSTPVGGFMTTQQKYYAYAARSRDPYDDDVIAVAICPVEVFDRTGYCYDQHLGELPGLRDFLEEVQESLYFLKSTHEDLTVENVIDLLTKLGYITDNEKYNNHCRRSDPFV